MTANNHNDLDTWLAQPPAPVESPACFHGAHDDCRDEQCPCQCGHPFQKLLKHIKAGREIDAAIDATNAEYRAVATVACVRAAIADVLDTGDSENAGEWLFYSTEPDWKMDERRGRFIDAVVERITRLQAPPHHMDRRLLELVKGDLEEMRRLAKERMER